MEYRILQDEEIDNPNQEDCFIVYDHRDFDVEVDGFDPEDIWTYLMLQDRFKDSEMNDFEDASQEAAEYSDYLNLQEEFGSYNIYPLYAYIHSGVALSLGNTAYPFNCQWDTSMSGFLITTKDYNGDKQSFIDTWNDYLSNGGLIVEFYVNETCKCCGNVSEQFMDSVGGFYSYEEANEYGKDYCIRNTLTVEL